LRESEGRSGGRMTRAIFKRAVGLDDEVEKTAPHYCRRRGPSGEGRLERGELDSCGPNCLTNFVREAMSDLVRDPSRNRGERETAWAQEFE